MLFIKGYYTGFMDSHTALIISSLVLLLIMSAFFSASETGFSAANRIRLKNLAAENNRRAKLALKLIENYDKLLSSVLIGNNLVNIASSALATVFFVGLFGNAGVSVATAVTTVMVLIFGEISPKTLAKESPEAIAMRTAPLLRIFIIILTPVNAVLSSWKRFILKIFRVRTDRSVTEDELLTFVDEVRQEGGINSQEAKMIRQVIEFDDITAVEIFTPRVDVAAVSIDDTAGAIDKKFEETGFSRLPVFKDTIDNITGVILLKDFHHQVMKQGKAPARVIKPVVYINKTMKAGKLLKTLQEKKSHMAVLVDEFGGTLGIATIEDIVEELVGEIWDEHDEVVEEIVRAGENVWRVLGSADLDDIFEFFALDRNKHEGKWNTTMGSWVLESLGVAPKTGDCFTYGNLEIKVTKILRHRVMEAEVRKLTRG
jgi:CBS domain containing-hemolysin-like protein